ncbi:MAG: D-glycero-beta-D-manno-heptose 1,7-bisphosphate 7-phosphatase [bacterium]|nr:D-glycero-beta-D-manno-heptose 1,7-bisphosphate 7-phosphatase [bacterium]
MGRRAILLDRDGTLNEEVGYVDHVERLTLIERSADAVRAANEAGWQTVAITNQSGVARGMLDESRLAEVHDRLRHLLAESGARLDGIYYCPHHPDEGAPPYRDDCDCRKPKAGMLLRARDEMGIDLSASYMVGDRAFDMAAGAAAGATPVLVLTGVGRRTLEDGSIPEHARPAHVAENLWEATRWILQHASENGG